MKLVFSIHLKEFCFEVQGKEKKKNSQSQTTGTLSQTVRRRAEHAQNKSIAIGTIVSRLFV